MRLLVAVGIGQSGLGIAVMVVAVSDGRIGVEKKEEGRCSSSTWTEMRRRFSFFVWFRTSWLLFTKDADDWDRAIMTILSKSLN